MLPEVVHDRVASVRESLKNGEEVTTQEASALPLRRQASVGGVSGLQKDGNDAPARVFGLRGLDVALNLVRVLVTAHLVLDQKQDSLLVLVVDARKNIDPVHLGPDFDGSHLWSLHPVVLAEEGLDEARTEPMEVRVRIPTGRVGPSEDIGEGGVDVVALRNVDERQRAQIVADERQVRGETRHPLVDVKERLGIGELHHGEERLLERVFDRRGRFQDLPETLVDELRDLQWMIRRASNAHRGGSKTARSYPTGRRS